jgi:hypothetical protein
MLEVFVSSHCFACKDSFSIAEDIRARYPEIRVWIRNIDGSAPHPEVFATPTYVLNGSTLWLGNPTEQEIERAFGPVNGVDHKAHKGIRR